MSKWIYRTNRDVVIFPPLYCFKGVKEFHNEWLSIDPVAGAITVRKQYSWDGCSPKLCSFMGLFWIGTPDGIVCKDGFTKTGKASMVHDALYQFLGEHTMNRTTCDEVFLNQMKRDEFVLAYPYYMTVRAFGGIFHFVRTKWNKHIAK
jgi:hypothetical protein